MQRLITNNSSKIFNVLCIMVIGQKAMKIINFIIC